MNKLVYFQEGYIVEQTLLERESNNPDFNFLSYQGTEENNYYRWRVFSLLQGDTENQWRTEPFLISENGSIWYPPLKPSKRIYLNIIHPLNLKNKHFITLQRRNH